MWRRTPQSAFSLPDQRLGVSCNSALQANGASFCHLLTLQLLVETRRRQPMWGWSSRVLIPRRSCHYQRAFRLRLHAHGRLTVLCLLLLAGRHRGNRGRALRDWSPTPRGQVATVRRGGVLLHLWLQVSRAFEDGWQLLDECGSSATELCGWTGSIVQLQAFMKQPGFILLIHWLDWFVADNLLSRGRSLTGHLYRFTEGYIMAG